MLATTPLVIDPEKVLLQESTQKVIAFQAEQLVRQGSYPASEEEDLHQELSLHLWQQLESYRPQRGTLSTFVDRVVRNKAISLARQQHWQCRDIRRSGPSLNTTVASDDGQPSPRCAGMGDGQQKAHRQVEPRNPQRDWELSQDLQAVLDNLSEPHRRLCEELMGERKRSCCCGTRKKLLIEIRQVLEEAGLAAYLG